MAPVADPDRRAAAHLQLLGVAWNFGWPVTTGVALGWWLDTRFGTSPWATLGLGLGAMVVAVRRLLDLAREESREDTPEEAREAARREAREESRREDGPGDRGEGRAP